MASDGGGKLRNRKNRNFKPYERPKTFFESMKDRVNKVFPVSSWLGSWTPSSSQNPPPLVAHGSSSRANDAWEGDEVDHGNCIRRNLNCDSNVLSQVNGDDSSDVDDMNSMHTEAVSESSLSKLKGALGRLTRDDQFARQTHSLLHTDDTDKSSDEGGARSSTPIWSLTGPQPCGTSIGLGGAPIFNASRFRSSLPSSARSSLSDLSGKESPFYEGKTRYGGASARTASLLSRAPYQLNRSRTVKVKQLNASSSEDLTGLSRTAQSILKTLEKMSTPVRDAQRIPPPLAHTNNSELIEQLCKTPTLRHRPKLSNSDRKSGPPVAHLRTPSTLTIRKPSLRTIPKPTFNESFKTSEASISESFKEREPRQSKTTGKMRAKITSSRRRAQPDEEEYLEEPDLPNVALPITNLPNLNFEAVPPPKSSVSGFKFAPPLSEDNLAVATKLTDGCKSFTFSSPLPSSKLKSVTYPKASVGLTVKSSESGPTVKTDNQEDSDSDKSDSDADVLNKSSSLQTDDDSDTVEFESITTPQSVSGFGDMFKKPPGSWRCNGCWVDNKTEDKKCVACQTPKEEAKPAPSNIDSDKSTSKAPLISGFGDKFKKPAGSWTCDSCWVSNDSDKTCCVACQTPKPSSVAKPKTALSDFKFGSQAAESAEKDSAEVKNNSTCQSSKTISGFGDKFKKEPGSWTCDDCLVDNKKDDTSCVCCKAKKPGAEPAKQTSGFGDAFKKKKGEWTCDGCYLQNKEDSSKCVACETPKPGAKAEKWNCKTCFVSNESSATRCTACSAPNEPKKANSNLAFTGKYTFGASTETPFSFGSGQPSGGFKFGGDSKDTASSNDKKESQGGFKFGSTPLTESTPSTGFQFGTLASSDAKEVKKPETAGDQVGTGFKFGASAATPASGFQFGSSGKGFQFGASSKEKPKESTGASEQQSVFGSVKAAAEMKTGSVLDFLNKKNDLLPKTETSAAASAEPKVATPPKAVFTFGTNPVIQPPADVNAVVTLPLAKPPQASIVPEKRTRSAEDSAPIDAKKPTFGSSDSEKKNLFVFGSSGAPQGSGFGGNVTFGLGATTTPMFGSGSAPQTALNFGSTGFGEANKQPTMKPAFGDNKAATPSNLFTFGAKPATFGDNSSSNMSIGSASNPPATFGGFGASSTATPSAPSGGFNFGAAPVSTQPTFQFSAGTTNPASQPSAGTASFNPAQSTPSFNPQSNTGFNFVPGAPNLNFAGTATPGQPFTFSASSSTTPQPNRVYRKAHRRIKK